jgi:mannosyltransferase
MRGLVLVIALALVVRAVGVGERSFWNDEAATIEAIRASDLSGVVESVRANDPGKGPLYYVLLRWWTAAFGESETTLRLPSVLAGAAAAGAVFLWARALLRLDRAPAVERSSFVPGAFAALNPVLIGLSREVRCYAFSHAAAFAAAACTVPAYLGETSEKVRRAARSAVPVLAAVAVGTHLYAAFFVAAMFFAVALEARRRRAELRPIVVGAVACAGLAALQLPFMGWHPQVDLGTGAGFPRLNARDLGHMALVLFGGSAVAWLAWALLLVGVVLGRGLAVVRAGVVSGGLAAAAFLAIDRLWVPLLETGGRYVAWSLASASIVAAAPLAVGSRGRAAVAGIATIAVAAAGAVAGRIHETVHSEDWRGVANLLSSRTAARDVVVCCKGFVSQPLALYYAGPAPVEITDDLTPAWALSSPPVARARAAGGRVWVVWSHAGELTADRVGALESAWGECEEAHRETAVRVLTFGR